MVAALFGNSLYPLFAMHSPQSPCCSHLWWRVFVYCHRWPPTDFSLSHFESETYTHCSVFHRFAATCAHLLTTVASLAALTQHKNPPWFHYEYEQYHNNLQTLSARHLVSVALTLVSHKSSCCIKKHATEVILTHFFSCCTELSVMKDEAWSLVFAVVKSLFACWVYSHTWHSHCCTLLREGLTLEFQIWLVGQKNVQKHRILCFGSESAESGIGACTTMIIILVDFEKKPFLSSIFTKLKVQSTTLHNATKMCNQNPLWFDATPL
jgi:hypothetical protein